MEKLKVFEAFAGYGTASFALKRLGIDFELVGFSEIDKYAVQCFEKNHHKVKILNEYHTETIYPRNYGDITKIDPNQLPDFDLFTGGFPCQAFSVAGKGLGELDPRGTLFYEIIRICEAKKPKYIFLENVKGLLSKKHKDTFLKILSELDRIGYHVNWRLLNTKDYGIPQNRERVFFVCFRKDIQTISTKTFSFPPKEELKIFIQDILEPEPVDSKYYLKEHQVKKLLEAITKKMKNGISKTIRSGGKGSLTTKHEWDIISIGNVNPSEKGINGEVYDTEGISPTITTNKGEGIKALITVSTDNISQQNRIYDSVGDNPTLNTNNSPKVLVHSLQPRSENRPSIVNGTSQGGSGAIWKEDGTTYCLDTGNTQGNSLSNKIFRKLTPKECFRLQGFLNDEINLDGISDSQQYKLAGNGQSVNVVAKIFERMLYAYLPVKPNDESQKSWLFPEVHKYVGRSKEESDESE